VCIIYLTGSAAAAAISSRVRVVMPYLVGWAIGRTHEQSSLLNMEDEGSQKAPY